MKIGAALRAKWFGIGTDRAIIAGDPHGVMPEPPAPANKGEA